MVAEAVVLMGLQGRLIHPHHLYQLFCSSELVVPASSFLVVLQAVEVGVRGKTVPLQHPEQSP